LRKKNSASAAAIKTVFIDAVIWIALLNSKDRKHEKAITLMKEILSNVNKSEQSIFLSEYVFSEVLAHVTVKQKRMQLTKEERKRYVQGAFRTIYNSRYVRILATKPSDLGTAFEYMHNNSGLTASFADWMSIILVKRHEISELVTVDPDLEHVTKKIKAFSAVKVRTVNLDP
jgi:predicted nucleic acid-binding protein